MLTRHRILVRTEVRQTFRAEALKCFKGLPPVRWPPKQVNLAEVCRRFGAHLVDHFLRSLCWREVRRTRYHRPVWQAAPILLIKVPYAPQRFVACAGLHQPSARLTNAAVPELHAQLLASARKLLPLIARGQPELVRHNAELHAGLLGPGLHARSELRCGRFHCEQVRDRCLCVRGGEPLFVGGGAKRLYVETSCAQLRNELASGAALRNECLHVSRCRLRVERLNEDHPRRAGYVQ